MKSDYFVIIVIIYFCTNYTNVKTFLLIIIFSNSNVVILPPGLQLSYSHPQMTIPQQPTVKILKRPQNDNTANENADKPKVQVKSLEQVC